MCMVSPDLSKRLIVNADDLGYDPEIDRGILEAHARGLVTSATAMVDTPFASAALRAAPASLRLGLHAVLDPALSRAQAEAELLRQIARFAALRGAPPSHLDSHKHHHARPELLAAFAAVAAGQRLPVRAIDSRMRDTLRAAGVRTTDQFLGDADLRPCWTKDRLADALAALEDGTTELMCHPGYAPSHARTSFGAEREVELLALCDSGARDALARSGATLATFAEIRGHHT
jgi:chitin disaccharide deacetylase